MIDAMLGIVQDATADSDARRKAAFKIAEFLLPKVGKKAKVLPDEYGFSVDQNVANGYRDIRLKLRALVHQQTRKIPEIAAKIKKLEARSDAIRRRLQVPCPTNYPNEEAANDYVRLMEFTRLRDNKTVLTGAELAEEAHLQVRYDVFAYSPESIARRRRAALQDAEARSKTKRAQPLSPKEQNDLALLRWLYPEPRPDPAQLDVDELKEFHDRRDELETLCPRPLRDEWPSSDGNFYPPDSEVRPIGVITMTWSGPDRPTNPPFSPWDAPASEPKQSAGP